VSQLSVAIRYLLLIILEDFAPGHIELHSVSISRDMASCDHDAGPVFPQSIEGDGGSGNHAAEINLKPFLVGGKGSGSQYSGRALPEVSGQGNGLGHVLVFQVSNEGLGVKETFPVRHFRHQPSYPAGAKS